MAFALNILNFILTSAIPGLHSHWAPTVVALLAFIPFTVGKFIWCRTLFADRAHVRLKTFALMTGLNIIFLLSVFFGLPGYTILLQPELAIVFWVWLFISVPICMLDGIVLLLLIFRPVIYFVASALLVTLYFMWIR